MGFGLILIIIGIFFIVLGFILEIISIILAGKPSVEKERGEVKAGGVLFIGPIPIVFGTDEEVAKWSLVIGLIMVILLVLYIFVFSI